MGSPTSFLPPLRRLDEFSASDLHSAIARLVVLYLPEVRGTAPVDEDLELLQADTFERPFAIRWLTGFIARGEEWVEQAPSPSSESESEPTAPLNPTIANEESREDTYESRSSALDRAAALLAACAGTSASGAISREFIFPTTSSPITITIRDESLSVVDHTAVGLQTWGSAYVLGERVAKDPSGFGVDPTTRVLEIGAGTGLLALLCGKLVDEEKGKDGDEDDGGVVIATDYHPAVLSNLSSNVSSNFPNSKPDMPPVQVLPLDWSMCVTGEPTTNLSRAPSTAVTPCIGTPAIQQVNKVVASSPLPSVTLSTQLQTPAFSTSLSPISTPRTPQTPRSPPPAPNLARAVFSRLMARGVQFDMPSEPLGLEKTLGEVQAEALGEQALRETMGEQVRVEMLGQQEHKSSCDEPANPSCDEVTNPNLNLVELDKRLTAAAIEGLTAAGERAHMAMTAVEANGLAVGSTPAADEGAPLTAVCIVAPGLTAGPDEALTAGAERDTLLAAGQVEIPAAGQYSNENEISAAKTSLENLHLRPLTFLCAPSGDTPLPRPALESESKPSCLAETGSIRYLEHIPEAQSTHEHERESGSIHEPNSSPTQTQPPSSTQIYLPPSTQTERDRLISTPPARSTGETAALSVRAPSTEQTATRCLDSSCPVHVSPAGGFLDTAACLGLGAETAPGASLPSVLAPCHSVITSDSTCSTDANCGLAFGLGLGGRGVLSVDGAVEETLAVQAREDRVLTPEEYPRLKSAQDKRLGISLDGHTKSSGENECPIRHTQVISESEGRTDISLPRTPGISEPQLQQVPLDKPFDEPFDTIFGADVVYELSHASLVHGVVSRLLRRPSYNPSKPSAHFHLIMPLRPTHADEATSVDRTFPRAEDVRAQGGMRDEEVLAIVGTETYARSAGVGRADEVRYVYYRIGWV